MNEQDQATSRQPAAATDPRHRGANSPSEATVDSPFGATPSTARGRWVRLAIYGGVLVAALAAAYILSSGKEEAGAAGGNNHESAIAPDSAAPVMLTPAEAQRIGVTYAVADTGSLALEVRTVGRVTFDETRVRAISPKVDGWVEDLYVDYTGQLVRTGQPLLSIYSPMLVSAQEELLLAKRLADDVAGGTPDAVRGAEELVSSARRRLRYWDIPQSEIDRVERTREVRRTLTLVAPAGGFVVEKSVLAGQRIMAGDALYRVADMSVVWVEGEIFEKDLAAVRVRQEVAADIQAFPGESWFGRISYIHPTLDPETRTVRVRVELPNPGLRLKPGMYATLRVRGGRRDAVLHVPRSAVLTTGERSLVFVKLPNGMLEPREIVLGLAGSERIEVRDGLDVGDSVVASATFLVDAESNLGAALGGMGNMPGMDMTAPVRPSDGPATAIPVAPRPVTPEGDATQTTRPARSATPAPRPSGLSAGPGAAAPARPENPSGAHSGHRE